jgi:hypothetical protein
MPEASSNEILQDCERFHALTIAPFTGGFLFDMLPLSRD